MPDRGDTPEIVLGRLLTHHGLDVATDLQIACAGTSTEAMQRTLAGPVEAAPTSEPGATAGVLRAWHEGRALRRAIDVQEVWAAMTGVVPVLRQAGLIVTQGFLDDHGAVLRDLLASLEAATTDVLADPEAGAANATGAPGLPDDTFFL